MTHLEIRMLMEAAISLDIRKVKITGGEPLMRSDILDIVRECAAVMDEVSMTTNGTKLALLAAGLKDAGLDRVNVSLDTFDRTEYEKIAGHDRLDAVREGITAAVDAGLAPVKVNIVAVSSATLECLMRDIRMVWELNAMPQIIEVVNTSDAYYPLDELEKFLTDISLKIKEREMHRRSVYTVEDAAGIPRNVELVRPMHNTEFCANCTRLRVTSAGMLKPCLMHNEGLVNIVEPLRRGELDNLPELFRQANDNRRPFWTDTERRPDNTSEELTWE